MIDLHCHILPGVDDGSAGEEESCMMAEDAADSGVTVIAATPHCNVPGSYQNLDPADLRRRLDALRALLRRQGIPVELKPGMEVFVTPQVPELLRRKQLLTLNDSRYLLVEFGFDEALDYADGMLEAIRAEGVVPVVAHPERYRFAQAERECLLRWARAGYVLQVNKDSLFGRFGRRAAELAHWCVGEGCVHLLGSDAHSPFRRTARLEEAWTYTAELDSPEIADFLLRDNPERILSDRPVKPVLAEF